MSASRRTALSASRTLPEHSVTVVAELFSLNSKPAGPAGGSTPDTKLARSRDKEQWHFFDEFAHRLAGLEERLQTFSSHLDELNEFQSHLVQLNGRVESHRHKTAAGLVTVARPKAYQINLLSYNLRARALSQHSSPTTFFRKITPAESETLINYGPNTALQPWLEHEP
ncbi:hypothetical protein MMC07_008708 [Pseudocyphellaria aurata]|nr:hypothetical protein [Pseudocyphellaria aurata]